MTDTRHAVILEGAEFYADLEGEFEGKPEEPATWLALRPDRMGG
jgi:hypothetical protein